MQALLGRWQVDVITATTVDEALQKIAEGPSVMLVDYHLHDRLDGLATLDALRAASPGPIAGALLTADGRDELKRDARERGYRLLTKPVKPAPAPPQTGGDDAVVLERRTQRTKPPQMYQVVLLNDDFTPMEFVVQVIQEYFSKDRETATQIMLKIHLEGKGVCGVYSRDIAETKVRQVNDYARQHQHQPVAPAFRRGPFVLAEDEEQAKTNKDTSDKLIE